MLTTLFGESNILKMGLKITHKIKDFIDMQVINMHILLKCWSPAPDGNVRCEHRAEGKSNFDAEQLWDTMQASGQSSF